MSTSNRKNAQTIGRWLDQQRGKPQYRPTPHAAKAVSRVMRPLSKKHGGGHTGLTQHWSQIVGEKLAKISKPVKFQGGKDGRSLIITAPGPAGALVMANSQAIIDKVNGFLGEGHIARIKVIQSKIKTNPPTSKTREGLSPLGEDKLRSVLENMDEGGLKSALSDLGRQILAQKRE